MSTAAAPMTMAEFLALPDDGTERWLIAGELRERERPMPYRNRFHSRVTTTTATELEIWSRQQPTPRGQVLTGDAGFRLSRDPDTIFGLDIAYVSASVVTGQTTETTIIDGLPILAVEILSPNDTHEDINDKIDMLLTAGVPLVWIIDPRRRTVTVHRPGAEPELVNVRQELSGEPHLPGFHIPVARLFE